MIEKETKREIKLENTTRKEKKTLSKKKKKCLKKSRKKKTNKKKGKIQSGVAYDPLTTKRKTPFFGRFTKQNKKNLQVKSPP
jgi:hypothetical protein